MTQLIIHADDFGMADHIDRGIQHAYREGVVTSTSLVAGGETFSSAVQIAKANPDLDIGIHLTLVGSTPVAEPAKIPTLLTGQGVFFASAWSFVVRYCTGKISQQEIDLELAAQCEKVLSTGLTITHIDSHQHLHMLPGIFELVTKLARKYNINAIRIPCESQSPALIFKLYRYPRLAQQIVLNYLCRKVTKNFICSDHFRGFLDGGQLVCKKLYDIIAGLPEHGVTEIMCHPGIADPQSPYATWGYHWQQELETLIDPKIKNFLAEKNIALISYRDLLRGEP